MSSAWFSVTQLESPTSPIPVTVLPGMAYSGWLCLSPDQCLWPGEEQGRCFDWPRSLHAQSPTQVMFRDRPEGVTSGWSSGEGSGIPHSKKNRLFTSLCPTLLSFRRLIYPGSRGSNGSHERPAGQPVLRESGGGLGPDGGITCWKKPLPASPKLQG